MALINCPECVKGFGGYESLLFCLEDEMEAEAQLN